MYVLIYLKYVWKYMFCHIGIKHVNLTSFLAFGSFWKMVGSQKRIKYKVMLVSECFWSHACCQSLSLKPFSKYPILHLFLISASVVHSCSVVFIQYSMGCKAEFLCFLFCFFVCQLYKLSKCVRCVQTVFPGNTRTKRKINSERNFLLACHSWFDGFQRRRQIK